MANTIKLGNGNWATKEGSLLAYNDENNNFKPLPFTTTRASSATVVNKQGLIETVGSGIPRIDFSDDANGALLLEPTATNIITYSEDFSNASWTKAGNTVVTLNNAISPDGTLNASTVTGLDGTSTNDLYTQPTFNTSNKTVTYSVYLKGSGTLRINVSNNVDDGSSKTLTLTNNWEKYFITYSFNATITTQIVCNLDDLSATATTYEIWGAQLEQNSYATSYIKTVGTTQTRVADTCNQTTASGLIGQTEGTLFVETTKWVESNNGRILSISDGTTSNYIIIIQNTTFSNYAIYIKNGGITQLSYSATNALANNSKIAISYKLNDFVISVNGEIVHTDTNGTVPSTSKIYIGSRESGVTTYYSNNPVKSVQVYTTALSAAELTSLTTI